ncbi:MAG: methionyl-tRNA formyltransferase [Bacteriovoracaceae bacterium]|nr:methionyl-tRNA formyltransferase [Bacteriovoracaceae bacterium]
MKKLKAIFFGTPDFSVATLELMAHHPLIELIAVVSMPDRPAGRGQELKSPEVIQFAKIHKIKTIQTENINKELDVLSDWEKSGVDIIVVLAFAQFLGSRILALPRLGCFNIHTSLLPKYRGAAPIQYALWSGDQSTGVSIQKMVKKMDAGDIVHSHPVKIHEYETGGMLTTRLKFQAALALSDLLEKISTNKVVGSPQDESLATFAPTLKKSDGHLDFKNSTLKQIKNRIQAMDPWPGTFCFMNNKRLKIFEVEKSPITLNPGQIQNIQNSMIVGCADGSLRILKLQLEGKKTCSDTELLNGWREEIKLTEPKKEET